MLLQSARELLVPDETSPGDQAVNRGLNLVFSISPPKIQMGVKTNNTVPLCYKVSSAYQRNLFCTI